MKKVLDILESIKRKEINIANLAKETGISASRIYKWRDRSSDITLKDAIILEEWANKVDNSIDVPANSEASDPNQKQVLKQILEVQTELLEAAKRIENKIDQVLSEGSDTPLDELKRDLQRKGKDVAGKGKLDKRSL